MTAPLAEAIHAGHHHATRCGLAIWCHEPAAQAHQDGKTGHEAAAVVLLLIVLALIGLVIRWRGKHKAKVAAAAKARRSPYPYGG
jgi:hypothetical protein